MIHSLHGPVLLNDAFGALLAYKLAIMLKYVARPKVCGDKVEFGIPFYDDLDATEKAITLHRIITGMFDPESPVLKENAYHAAALAALENGLKESIELEINMRGWFEEKYGKEDRIVRALIISAFQTRYPHDRCSFVESTDTLIFLQMIDRLFSEIRLKPYFLIADVPKTKRKILMERLAVPDDYFAPLEGKNKMPEKDRKERCRVLLLDAMDICLSTTHHWLKTDRTSAAARVAEAIS